MNAKAQTQALTHDLYWEAHEFLKANTSEGVKLSDVIALAQVYAINYQTFNLRDACAYYPSGEPDVIEVLPKLLKDEQDLIDVATVLGGYFAEHPDDLGWFQAQLRGNISEMADWLAGKTDMAGNPV